LYSTNAKFDQRRHITKYDDSDDDMMMISTIYLKLVIIINDDV